MDFREWSKEQVLDAPITRAYGGHYFSPAQALWIDAYCATLPVNYPDRTVALAAVIRASSRCVAAPGHTAQPFQPTRTARPFLEEAWSRELRVRVREELKWLAERHAMKVGAASVGDANEMAEGLLEGDLVFLDPPIQPFNTAVSTMFSSQSCINTMAR